MERCGDTVDFLPLVTLLCAFIGDHNRRRGAAFSACHHPSIREPSPRTEMSVWMNGRCVSSYVLFVPGVAPRPLKFADLDVIDASRP